MLYTLSSSPNWCSIPIMLRLLMPGDALLLLQDGVLAALPGPTMKIFFPRKNKLYALKEDLDARGLTSYISYKITIINYTKFVQLTEKYCSQIAW